MIWFFLSVVIDPLISLLHLPHVISAFMIINHHGVFKIIYLLQSGISIHMAATTTIPDGATIAYGGRTFVMDDGELVEIAGSYPDMETALKALHDGLSEK